MANPHQSRYQFISHALNGDGPFRPVVTYDAKGAPVLSGATALVHYPRESDLKFARRNEVAFYDGPMFEVCARFVGYLGQKQKQRDLPHDLYQVMADDIDGRGNKIDVFWQSFMVDASARGAMLLLVDMPPAMEPNLASQIAARAAPFWTSIAPEIVTDYAIGDDGKFDYVEFSGSYTQLDGKKVLCTWHFDREMWEATDEEKNILDASPHPLGECPVLIFTEQDSFPCFGRFSVIADLAKRLFNLHSELDEILRAQTFSLLTMQVPDNTPNGEKLEAAKTAGETIGTNNLLVHTGSTPAFISPDSGPAETYLNRIKALETRIDQIGLKVEGSNAQESGVSLQMRFRSLNAALGTYAGRMEDLENRAWYLSSLWLGMGSLPKVTWERDFDMADVAQELAILQQMQAAAMPTQVIAEQQKRVVHTQFSSAVQKSVDEMTQAIDERIKEVS